MLLRRLEKGGMCVLLDSRDVCTAGQQCDNKGATLRLRTKVPDIAPYTRRVRSNQNERNRRKNSLSLLTSPAIENSSTSYSTECEV